MKFINYNKYNFWMVILFALLALSGVNYLVNKNIRSFIGPSQKIIDDLNSLMRG